MQNVCQSSVGIWRQSLNKTAKYLITWQLVPTPFTPAGQVPIVFLPQGFGRGQLLRLHIQYFILQIPCQKGKRGGQLTPFSMTLSSRVGGPPCCPLSFFYCIIFIRAISPITPRASSSVWISIPLFASRSLFSGDRLSWRFLKASNCSSAFFASSAAFPSMIWS